MTNTAFFPPDSPEPQPSGQYSLLIGVACVLGAVMMIAMFVGFALFSSWKDNWGEGRRGGPCCGTAKIIQNKIIQNNEFLPLYGRTIHDEDFDWESLRGKYVLVKFTATWCGPCQREIPGMLEAYEKYQDKGLEIVSVYIWQRDSDPVAVVKNYVEKQKMPWIILSEALSEKAGQPPHGEKFGIEGVPTMILVDKEGKVHATDMRGDSLKRELKKLFGE